MTEIGKNAKHKTTHQDGGDDEIDATGLAGRCDFVDRGDPSDNDFTQATLTQDNAWHDLDLSAIVPAGAKAVLIHVSLVNELVGQAIRLRKNGNTNEKNVAYLITQVASLRTADSFVCFLDSDRKIEYILSASSFAEVILNIGCWWI